MDSVAYLPTLDELRLYVLQRLCQHDHLDPQQTPMKEAVILRRGKPCGLFFQANGPRLLKTYAVWAGEENRILFYDCNGLRFTEVRLSEAPDPAVLTGEKAPSSSDREPEVVSVPFPKPPQWGRVAA